MEFVRQMGGDIHVQSGRSKGNLFWFAVDLRAPAHAGDAGPGAIETGAIGRLAKDQAAVATGH